MLFEDINALFIHIPKTAGLSIEQNLLSRYNGFNVKSHHTRFIDTPQSVIQENFTFSFVRNPWDRLVSFYHFIGPGAPIYPKRLNVHQWAPYVTRQYIYPRGNSFRPISFKEFVIHYLDQSHCPHQIKYSLEWDSFDWLANSDGELDLDYIGRFSNLTSDFKTLCDKLDIDYFPLIKSNESTHTKYTDYYDSELRSYVAEKYYKEIDYFDFKFGD